MLRGFLGREGDTFPRAGESRPEGAPEYQERERQEDQTPEQLPTPIENITIPKKLAGEILPTVYYLFRNDRENEITPEQEYDTFKSRRNHDPIAILLDPDRIKTEREEQNIDNLVAGIISSDEAQNREQAMQVLYHKHLYAPPRVQQYWRIIGGLNQQKPIKPEDFTFLWQKLESRRDHEEGVSTGDEKHWSYKDHGGQPPTRKEKMKAIRQKDEMNNLLTKLNQLQHGEYHEEQ